MKYAKISSPIDDMYYIIVSYENVNLWTNIIFVTKPATRDYSVGILHEKMSAFIKWDGEYNKIQYLTKEDAFLESI